MPHIHFLNLNRRLAFEKTKGNNSMLIIKICFHRWGEFSPRKKQKRNSKQWVTNSQTRWDKVHIPNWEALAQGKRRRSPIKSEKDENQANIMQANAAKLERKSQRGLVIQNDVKLQDRQFFQWLPLLSQWVKGQGGLVL